MAIAPKTRGQEEKVGTGLNRLNEEDPSFTLVNNAETKQLVLSGSGDQHLDVLVSKLKTRFGVDATLSPAKVAYREKIKKKVEAHGRHTSYFAYAFSAAACILYSSSFPDTL